MRDGEEDCVFGGFFVCSWQDKIQVVFEDRLLCYSEARRRRIYNCDLLRRTQALREEFPLLRFEIGGKAADVSIRINRE